jgi:hypothetical protein
MASTRTRKTLTPEEKQRKKDEKLYQDNKERYHIEVANKNKVPTITLWKNSPYGYDVFVCYIDYDEAVKQAIIKDLKS